MFGFALLAIGLLISVGAWNVILSHQGGNIGESNLYPVLGYEYPFWMQFSYTEFIVPDYLLNYLILGVFTATVGITILASAGWKRLEMYSDSQQVRPVGETNDG